MSHDLTIAVIAAACYVAYRLIETSIRIHRARQRVSKR